MYQFYKNIYSSFIVNELNSFLEFFGQKGIFPFCPFHFQKPRSCATILALFICVCQIWWKSNEYSFSVHCTSWRRPTKNTVFEIESFDKDEQYYSPLLHHLKGTEIGDLGFIPLFSPSLRGQFYIWISLF